MRVINIGPAVQTPQSALTFGDVWEISDERIRRIKPQHRAAEESWQVQLVEQSSLTGYLLQIGKQLDEDIYTTNPQSQNIVAGKILEPQLQEDNSIPQNPLLIFNGNDEEHQDLTTLNTQGEHPN